jgi:thiol-disulfide isomerase/thioredoxin
MTDTLTLDPTSFDGATDWVGSPKPLIELLWKEPLLVMFWSMTCPICIMNLSKIRYLIEDRLEKRLPLLLIHRPRFDPEMNPVVAEERLTYFKMANYPCAVDNNHAIAQRFGLERVWPSYLLFARSGQLAAQSSGLRGAEEIENAAMLLFGETK